jgi:hypothetical protein
LDLPFSDQFLDHFSIARLSGDSGRSSGTIERRPQRLRSESLRKEIEEATAYKRLLDVMRALSE